MHVRQHHPRFIENGWTEHDAYKLSRMNYREHFTDKHFFYKWLNIP